MIGCQQAAWHAGRATVGGVPPVKRWYDSRARVTLKMVASWLRVPWRKVTNFECLLVYQLMLPSEEKRRAPATPWEHSLRAAKIGAAALGIGALFAVTGESQCTGPAPCPQT